VQKESNVGQQDSTAVQAGLVILIALLSIPLRSGVENVSMDAVQKVRHTPALRLEVCWMVARRLSSWRGSIQQQP
jgi:uncharacterized membrane protein